MSNKAVKIFALSALMLGATVASASAECHRAVPTLLGAGAGSVVLGAITHSPAGWIGGAVLGGLAGHTIASENCHEEHHYRHGYYDQNHHWHNYS